MHFGLQRRRARGILAPLRIKCSALIDQLISCLLEECNLLRERCRIKRLRTKVLRTLGRGFRCDAVKQYILIRDERRTKLYKFARTLRCVELRDRLLQLRIVGRIKCSHTLFVTNIEQFAITVGRNNCRLQRVWFNRTWKSFKAKFKQSLLFRRIRSALDHRASLIERHCTNWRSSDQHLRNRRLLKWRRECRCSEHWRGEGEDDCRQSTDSIELRSAHSGTL